MCCAKILAASLIGKKAKEFYAGIADIARFHRALQVCGVFRALAFMSVLRFNHVDRSSDTTTCLAEGSDFQDERIMVYIVYIF